MDVGQMGGGDKLFEAIDRGIRGAHVMISCVTPKYSQSDNCKRELNLAINLGKPLIPLQMERMTWPPAGPMGPMLSEYIFLRMFKKQEDNSGVFWPPERFTQLLMQVRYHAAPCYEEVQPEYANWWQPPEEDMEKIKEAILTKRSQSEKKETSSESVGKNSSIIESVDPQVFLSYQWDNKANVKALYMKLTRLGYTCWMDIYMMGGGDSLYDKIDRGIRKCDVVVSCATPKYSQSSNCRREISLADAIKKPIIPLILKEMKWPPEGPMSMIFSQLLAINFTKHLDELNSWDGQLTDQLIEQIGKHTSPNSVKNSAVTDHQSEKKLSEKKNDSKLSPSKDKGKPLELKTGNTAQHSSTSKDGVPGDTGDNEKAQRKENERSRPDEAKTSQSDTKPVAVPDEKQDIAKEKPKIESPEETRSKACVLL